jgi:hypothetical protein
LVAVGAGSVLVIITWAFEKGVDGGRGRDEEMKKMEEKWISRRETKASEKRKKERAANGRERRGKLGRFQR